jgi:hypothetical protein
LFNEDVNTDNDQHLKCLFMNLINLIYERNYSFEEILELEQVLQTTYLHLFEKSIN